MPSRRAREEAGKCGLAAFLPTPQIHPEMASGPPYHHCGGHLSPLSRSFHPGTGLAGL